ncbi:MAG TPA: S-methyl-5-thioribose-1-phosphate isomerase [Solirubrobacteraceae bacterium]|jgi:methylthioribose-1-phosphate isomerase
MAIVEPLRWEDGALLVLDQRLLPGEELWLRCTTVSEVVQAIETLAVRGAPAIGIAAAYGAALASEGDFEGAIARLGGTRPTAINLRWALDRVREAGAARALDIAHEIARREAEATRIIAERGAALFDEPQRVMTHCNAGALATGGVGTALGVIRAAHDAGHITEVWVPETRPLLQGARLTAYELAHDEIPHTVVTDSSAGLLMSRGLVDIAVVGADRIAANGDVANKIGTYPLAALAARHGIPFYVAAPTSTIDPNIATGAEIPIEEREPDELGTPGDSPAANFAFDVTPHDLVTAIVTEEGVFRPPYAFATR